MNDADKTALFESISRSIKRGTDYVEKVDGQPGSLEVGIEITKLQTLFLIAVILDEKEGEK